MILDDLRGPRFFVNCIFPRILINLPIHMTFFLFKVSTIHSFNPVPAATSTNDSIHPSIRPSVHPSVYMFYSLLFWTENNFHLPWLAPLLVGPGFPPGSGQHRPTPGRPSPLAHLSVHHQGLVTQPQPAQRRETHHKVKLQKRHRIQAKPMVCTVGCCEVEQNLQLISVRSSPLWGDCYVILFCSYSVPSMADPFICLYNPLPTRFCHSLPPFLMHSFTHLLTCSLSSQPHTHSLTFYPPPYLCPHA